MKEQHLHLRVGSAEKALVRCAAREAGISASRFVLEAAVAAAEEAVSRQNRFVVPREQWADFVAALNEAGAGWDPLVRSTAEAWLAERNGS